MNMEGLLNNNNRKYIVSKTLIGLKKFLPLYLMLLLPIVYLILFHYYPMYGAQIAFKDFKAILGIEGSPWVGFKHFQHFLTSYQFWRIVPNTLILSFYGLFASLSVTVVFALALNAVRSNAFRKTVQMASYMPHFISVVVTVGILIQLFNPRLGIIGQLVKLVWNSDRDMLGYPWAFSHIYVWSGIWQNMGWRSIIYLAALASVDPTQHEAAMIDGANRFQRILHIDLPAIIPTIVILLILDAGQIMNVGFEKVFLMQNNLNISSSEIISTYVYKIGIAGIGGRIDYSYASAIGLFNSMINFLLVVVVNQLAKKMKQTSLW